MFWWPCCAGVVVLFVREPVIGLYEISASAANSARTLMLIFSLTAWVRSINFILFVGALRAGGDTRFAMFMELFSIWVIGVPAALIGGFVLKLPVYGVYMMVFLEEVVKVFIITASLSLAEVDSRPCQRDNMINENGRWLKPVTVF